MRKWSVNGSKTDPTKRPRPWSRGARRVRDWFHNPASSQLTWGVGVAYIPFGLCFQTQTCTSQFGNGGLLQSELVCPRRPDCPTSADCCAAGPTPTPARQRQPPPAGDRHSCAAHRRAVPALGVVCYEMLTGHRPFEGDNGFSIARAIVHTQPVAISRQASIPTTLADLVMRCLEEDPTGRPASAAEVLRALDTPTNGNAHASSQRAQRLRRIRAILLALVVMLAIAAVAGF
jgi:hypothetical protein